MSPPTSTGSKRAPPKLRVRPNRSPQQRVVDERRPSTSNRPSSAPQQAPSPRLALQQPLQHAVTSTSDSELKLSVINLPVDWDAKHLYARLKQYGRLIRIEGLQSESTESARAVVIFSPAPWSRDWLSNGIIFDGRRITFTQLKSNTFQHRAPDSGRMFAQETSVSASELHFGVESSKGTMLSLYSIDVRTPQTTEVSINLMRKTLDIGFALPKHNEGSAGHGSRYSLFRMRLHFPQIREVVEMGNPTNHERAWLISLTDPPMIYRKTDQIDDTFEPGAKDWNEWHTWCRQTDVGLSTRSRNTVTQLEKKAGQLDFGRWLSHFLLFKKDTVVSKAFREMRHALDAFVTKVRIAVVPWPTLTTKPLWSWLDDAFAVLNTGAGSSSSGLDQMAQEVIHLPFEIRYQLEVCISHGVLHECNIDVDFIKQLAAMESRRATRLLEKAADNGKRFFDPNSIFAELLPKVTVARKPGPAYCAYVRAATITPTTIYFMTPVLETSNRVVRKFQRYADRFLRVKFLDERYKGRIQSEKGAIMDEVYTRVKRTMVNGIRVADRHYEFLAFGNSQFREHGAWFFAPTSDLTAQQIRDQLGDFSSIKVIAKYCSRIGQCFSTTRATDWSVRSEPIPDIERNGFCFTDGVGKISPFLARMIAQGLGYPSSEKDCPSAFQFRYEGCKGILIVDDSLKNSLIQIRPSQEKFTAMSHRGLEIVRVSQYATAYLNVQLILVLSTLGVADEVFVDMMQSSLLELEEALTSEKKARELLQKNIDYNRMTIQLSIMISDGFMETQDPFMMSCLRLWRAWSIKYLKEKARIFVGNGAFVLGCVDETATLKGHFNIFADVDSSNTDERNTEHLPEIFLQIDPTGEGKWQIIEGVCALARNPSLHPGDVRIVRAVNAPSLHHIRNCVVFPQTGDRDLANMCSGGDLDGDDYLVIWDEDLLPKEWNHPPMDYTAPPPVLSKNRVTVDDLTSFFVTHMKHDNLGLIAVNHKYWADQPNVDQGVKDPRCLELARLHSMAVDYAKTGVPAEMPKHLFVKSRPHWSEPRNRSYHSYKVLGKLYDQVKRIPFEPAWSMPFDKRILDAYTIGDQMLADAREVKDLYDTAMQRVMAKFSIETEFEVWTTFVLKHSDDMGDYKFAETIGEAANALKDTYQKLCWEKAGANEQERDWSKMSSFVAAMYTVTAQDVMSALKRFNETQPTSGPDGAGRPGFQDMPFMSFPWLFPTELGNIAKKRDPSAARGYNFNLPNEQLANTQVPVHKSNVLEELEEVKFSDAPIEFSTATKRYDSPLPPDEQAAGAALASSSVMKDPSRLATPSSVALTSSSNGDPIQEGSDNHETDSTPQSSTSDLHESEEVSVQTCGQPPESDEDEENEVEHVTFEMKPSILDTFERFANS